MALVSECSKCGAAINRVDQVCRNCQWNNREQYPGIIARLAAEDLTAYDVTEPRASSDECEWCSDGEDWAAHRHAFYVSRDGASARTADDLAVTFLEDVADILETLSVPDPAGTTARETATYWRDKLPDGGWVDNPEHAEGLHDDIPQAEARLAHVGLYVEWDDGYVISTVEEVRAIQRETGWNIEEWAESHEWGAVGVGPVGRSRDSDTLETSNWEVIYADGREKFGDAVDWVRFGHWAVGWVEELTWDASRGDVCQWVQGWRDALDNYPVADDEDYSRREYEDMLRYLGDVFGEINAEAAWRYLWDTYSATRPDDVTSDMLDECAHAIGAHGTASTDEDEDEDGDA